MSNRIPAVLRASLLAATLLLSHADLPVRAQEDTPDPAPVEDVQPADDAPAPVPECADWVVPYNGGGDSSAPIFVALKKYLMPTGIDVGSPCGPFYYGCEGYCQRQPDFQAGQLIVETTTNGWVFWRALYNAPGFTDGRQQWVWVADYRPPLVLGPPLWFCDHPDLVAKVAFPGCR